MANHRSRLVWRHALRSLVQQRTLASLRLLALSGVVAVVAVASILSLSAFMKATLVNASSELLAGDRQLVSPRPVEQSWLDKADALNLTLSLAVEFRTMVFSPTGSQLVEVKAVDSAYPLKGELKIEGQSAHRMESGSAVMQARLFSLLDLTESGLLSVGDAEFRLTGVLVQEPDVGFNIGGLQPRVLMHRDDLGSTNVLQPGSRSKWRYYIVGSNEALETFDAWIEPKLNGSQRYQGVQGGRPAIASAMERAEAYLVLASSLAVLLGCLAISLCARQYAQNQVLDVAILKTLGFTPSSILALFLIKLSIISVIVLGLGLVISQLVAVYMLDIVRPLFDGIDLSNTFTLEWQAVAVSAGMTVISVIGFSLPQIIALRRVSPQAVLRPESGLLPNGSRFVYAIVCSLVAAILLMFTQNIKLVVLFFVASLALVIVVGCVVWLLLKALAFQPVARFFSSAAFRLAFNNLKSQPSKTIFQASVYAFALCLLALIFIVRDSLLTQWQAQLPEDAPNHFLINIRDHQIVPLEDALRESNVEISKMYPMVRGRLSHINGEDVKVAVTKDVGALNRELNLSWANELPTDNEIVEGRWFASGASTDKAEAFDSVTNSTTPLKVSIEEELSGEIGVELGDSLSFSIGPERIEAEVVSIRKVQWESMRPNFYVFFEEGALDEFSRTYISSFFIEDKNKKVLNKLSRDFPTISILELDTLIIKIRSIVSQVSKMLEVVLWLVLSSAVLVVAAITVAKLQDRVHEAGVLRTFGAKASTLRRSYFIEFALLGLLAALSGLFCAELGLNLVTGIFLNSDVVVHPELWITYPLFSAAILGSLGFGLLRKVLSVSPMASLR